MSYEKAQQIISKNCCRDCITDSMHKNDVASEVHNLELYDCRYSCIGKYNASFERSSVQIIHTGKLLLFIRIYSQEEKASVQESGWLT